MEAMSEQERAAEGNLSRDLPESLVQEIARVMDLAKYFDEHPLD